MNNKHISCTCVSLFLVFILRGSFLHAQTDSVQVWMEQSKLALQKDNRTESLVWAKKAFEQAHAEGNAAKIGNASIHLAEIYRVNDSLKSAEEIATTAVKLFGKTEQNESTIYQNKSCNSWLINFS